MISREKGPYSQPKNPQQAKKRVKVVEPYLQVKRHVTPMFPYPDRSEKDQSCCFHDMFNCHKIHEEEKDCLRKCNHNVNDKPEPKEPDMKCDPEKDNTRYHDHLAGLGTATPEDFRFREHVRDLRDMAAMETSPGRVSQTLRDWQQSAFEKKLYKPPPSAVDDSQNHPLGLKLTHYPYYNYIWDKEQRDAIPPEYPEGKIPRRTCYSCEYQSPHSPGLVMKCDTCDLVRHKPCQRSPKTTKAHTKTLLTGKEAQQARLNTLKNTHDFNYIDKQMESLDKCTQYLAKYGVADPVPMIDCDNNCNNNGNHSTGTTKDDDTHNRNNNDSNSARSISDTPPRILSEIPNTSIADFLRPWSEREDETSTSLQLRHEWNQAFIQGVMDGDLFYGAEIPSRYSEGTTLAIALELKEFRQVFEGMHHMYEIWKIMDKAKKRSLLSEKEWADDPQETFKNQLGEIERTYTSEIECLKSNMEEKNCRIKELLHQRHSSEVSCHRLQEVVDRQSGLLIDRDVNKAKISSLRVQVCDLYKTVEQQAAQLQALQEEKEAAEARVKAMQQEIIRAQMELRSFKDEYNQLSGQFKAISKVHSTLSDQEECLRQERENLMKDVNGATSKILLQLEDRDKCIMGIYQACGMANLTAEDICAVVKCIHVAIERYQQVEALYNAQQHMFKIASYNRRVQKRVFEMVHIANEELVADDSRLFQLPEHVVEGLKHEWYDEHPEQKQLAEERWDEIKRLLGINFDSSCEWNPMFFREIEQRVDQVTFPEVNLCEFMCSIEYLQHNWKSVPGNSDCFLSKDVVRFLDGVKHLKRDLDLVDICQNRLHVILKNRVGQCVKCNAERAFVHYESLCEKKKSIR